MGWCDSYKKLQGEGMVCQGHDGPFRVTFNNYKNYYTCYIKYCPFCGAKLIPYEV